MKPKNTLENLFDELQGSFDVSQPSDGHRERFQQRLADQGSGGIAGARRTSWWRPLAIAASLAIFMSASIFFLKPEPSMAQQVAEISPEVSQTSFHFASLIQQQIQELEKQGNPETQPLINEALQQLEKLEADYDKMEQDLVNGGNSKLILSAMITNFQTRIDLLQDVMAQVEQIKQFKNNSDENSI